MKKVFDLTITTLAPLHIGSGSELRRDFDYVTHEGHTWVMSPEGMLDAFVDENGIFDSRIVGRPASELLEDKDFRTGSPYFRYVLPGEPTTQGSGAVLREQYKDAHERPYIPGSSIKGALRTVLAWHGFRTKGMSLKSTTLGNSRSWAGQPMEQMIFGRNPNYDLLRGIHVADSEPQKTSTLSIVNARVITGAPKPGSPVEIEAVREGTLFRTSLRLDEYLHSSMAEQQLKYGERWQWLEQLPVIARAWAEHIFTSERDWFRQRKYDKVGRLYHHMLGLLKTNKLPDDQFFLQIGWGGGWNVKTIGAPLQQDSEAWNRLLSDRKLTPARMRARPGEPFPKSRRVAVINEQVVAPLGWCLVEMKARTP